MKQFHRDLAVLLSEHLDQSVPPDTSFHTITQALVTCFNTLASLIFKTSISRLSFSWFPLNLLSFKKKNRFAECLLRKGSSRGLDTTSLSLASAMHTYSAFLNSLCENYTLKLVSDKQKISFVYLN